MKNLPPIGQRIIKSAAAVALCMIVYYFRTKLPIGNGIPFYSALAALWCMQLFDVTVPITVYLAASVFVIPVIYTAVVLEHRNAAFFSCVVFLSIALTHSFDENPYLFVLNRVLDTFIGIILGITVNDFRLPVRHDNETLYVCGLDDVLISDSASYNKTELNRLIRSGVKFTVSTTRTPAELLSIMKDTELNLPVIVMDGAVLYDVKEKQYLETVFLPQDVSDDAERLIEECGMHCFVNVMLDTTLLIYYGDFRNAAEQELFASHRHSPYRNYVHADYRRRDHTEHTLYITVLAEKTDILTLESMLRPELRGRARISVSHSEYDGYLYLKIFSPYATKQNMLRRLKAYTGAQKTVTFGSIEGAYDVYIGDGGGNATVKKLKRVCRHGNLRGNV